MAPVLDPLAVATDTLEFFGPEYLFYSFPPSALCPLMAKKLFYFLSCSLLLVAFLGNCQGLASRSHLRNPRALPLIPVNNPCRGLLFILMEFLTSCLVAEVSLQKNVQRRCPGGYLILHYCL